MTQKLEWTDTRKNWEDVKPGWYEYQIALPEIETQASFVKWYADILEWIYEYIPNCEQHCRWMFDDKFHIKFRYERDYLYFALRW